MAHSNLSMIFYLLLGILIIGSAGPLPSPARAEGIGGFGVECVYRTVTLIRRVGHAM
jgi:hypothetical protein